MMSNEHLEPGDLLDAPEQLFTSTGTGRAAVDERGNSVWEWQTAPGVYSREISPQQLQALQAPDLQIVEREAHATLHHLDTRGSYARRA